MMYKKLVASLICFSMFLSTGVASLNTLVPSNNETYAAKKDSEDKEDKKDKKDKEDKKGKKGKKEKADPSDEHLNKYPADTGVVPKGKGKDKRPKDPNCIQPNEKPTTPELVNQPNTNINTPQTVIQARSSALVLYDTTGDYGWLGEMYAISAQNLATHFGVVKSKPVTQKKAGELKNYTAVIYVGSTYEEPLPVSFLDDVLANKKTNVVWMNNNIWQLNNRSLNFAGTFGFEPNYFDFSVATSVTYKGVELTRDPLNGGGLMNYAPTMDTTKTTVLATARRADGTPWPWAVRSNILTYIGEIPFAYISGNDRYLAFCDMLFDALSPTTTTRHRALVRLEDVSPDSDPVAFRASVDYLYSAGVPFSVALIPQYVDPLGYYNNGVAETITWKDKPDMLAAVKYATTKGGTLILHGFTHQSAKLLNPYSGVTGDDFEFFRAHVDPATNNVIYDGAVANDSASFALGRINAGLKELKDNKIPTPSIFEFPHYAGSPTDAKAIKTIFPTAYHRGLYFSGGLNKNPENLSATL